MTAVFETNDVDKSQPKEVSPNQLFNSLSNSDWQTLSPKTATRSSAEPASGELSFDPNIYNGATDRAITAAKPLNSPPKDASADKNDLAKLNKDVTADVNRLKADEKALESDSKDTDKNDVHSKYHQELAKLDKDESSLHKDVMGFLKESESKSNYKDFSAALEKDHPELKEIATKLYDMGLKNEASKTTADYPLNHYEHHFGKTGSGGGGKGPAGSTDYKNLDTTTEQHVDTNPKDIGGRGGVKSATATQDGANRIDFSMTGGKWADALWRQDNQTAQAVGAKSVQLDTNFELTPEQLKNTHEIEKDIVFQKPDGTFGILGSQINPKTGEVDFWNSQTHHWIDEGSLGPLQANKAYNLQLSGTINDTGNPNTGSYTYTGYSLNGNKLDSTKNTFGTIELKNKEGKPTPWTPGVYIQTQLDLGAAAGTAGMTEFGEQLYINDNS